MPFITEELWQGLREYYPDNLPPQLDSVSAPSVMRAPYPDPEEFPLDIEAETEMNFLQRIIGAVRNIRSEMRVPPERKADLVLSGCNADHRRLVESNSDDMIRLAGLATIGFDGKRPKRAATAVVDEVELFLPLAGLIDIDLERSRLDKEIDRLQKLVSGAEAKLANEKFVSNAPDKVIQHEREKLESCRDQLVLVEKNRLMLD